MSPVLRQVFPFLAWRDRVNRDALRADAIAGLVGALVVLPQGVAYATLAGMPAQYGLYAAMVPAVIAALWGSSWHLVSGPTNALSLVVFATVAPLALPGSETYIGLVLTLCLMVGIIQFAAGVARLGALVNFISHTVVVGFTAGAGLLIIAAQLKQFFGIALEPGASFFRTLAEIVRRLHTLDPAITAVGVVTLAIAILSKRHLRRVPYMIVAMVGGSLFGWLLVQITGRAIPVVGSLPSAVPPLSMPSFDPDAWRQLAPAALALTVLGLTEAVSIGRAIALRSGQRIDGNQEFIGQGLSNLAGAFFSAYPSSGSFNRSGVNYEAGARTPLSAVFAAGLLVLVLFAVAPLAAWLPLTVMAALLFIVAWGLIDVREIRRILNTHRGDAFVLVVTFLATLSIQLEFAIFVGVLASLFVYLQRTTHPHLTRLVPDPLSRHFAAVSATAPPCPQLDILRVEGSLFFGAVEHVRDEFEAARKARPEVRHILLVASGINFVDVAGAELLAGLARDQAASGGRLYVCNLKPAVREVLERAGTLQALGEDALFDGKAEAIAAIYAKLDPAKCATCTVLAFRECHPALPGGLPRVAPRPEFALTVQPAGAGENRD